jgi:signal transduction histidine kinase
MEKIKNLSFRKAIVLYVAIALICSFFFSALIVYIAKTTQKNIWSQYIDREKFYEAFQLENEYDFIADIPRVNSDEMTASDAFFSELCDFLETWTVLILSMLGSIISILLFYKNKIKKPLIILTNATELIAENHLDFRVEYDVKDEMGRLCHEFERMRAQLQINNKKMWTLIEQEKDLRAAIAHDIRSPLAVMRGYQEMLLEFIPMDVLDRQKMMEILNSGMGQIERMNHFTDTMKELSKLEDLQIKFQKIDSKELTDQMVMLFKTICSQTKISWNVRDIGLTDTFMGDLQIIMEVCENLLSNATRFARERIDVVIGLNEDELSINFYDDGIGFTEDIEKVTKAYYHSNPGDDLNHYGLGLYLCRLYCEKHGGKLLLGNKDTGGAYVKACFQIKEI